VTSFEPAVADSAYVAATAILVGRISVGPRASIWYGTVLDGTEGAVVIGSGSSIQDRAVVRAVEGHSVLVEEDTTVGHGAILLGCRVERGAMIGLNAVVLPGAVIGAGALVAAGAVVPVGTCVPPGVLVAGTPAVVKKPLSGRAQQWVATAAAEYQRLAGRYLARSHKPFDSPE
jgi:carbonic anhydrase/acetyltransferase-like protein (isoleucine patch superfamily)